MSILGNVAEVEYLMRMCRETLARGRYVYSWIRNEVIRDAP
jgi:hypothetical protein